MENKVIHCLRRQHTCGQSTKPAQMGHGGGASTQYLPSVCGSAVVCRHSGSSLSPFARLKYSITKTVVKKKLSSVLCKNLQP